jgi:hypothetical protein
VNTLLDLDCFPLDRPSSQDYANLVSRCRKDLATDGMFNLVGLIKPETAAAAAAEIKPIMEKEAFTHKREHNIYFKREIPGLAPDHPALKLCETVNHTLCADQLDTGIVMQVYQFEPLAAFIADCMGKDQLHLMADPLARVNVMAYREGEALNWHFDRSEFTTTLLLQAPQKGGDFVYRTDLRTNEDPNYDGVAKLLNGQDPEEKVLEVTAGTLNVFKGKNTAHRVSPVVGDRQRLIAVFSYYENPGVVFTKEDQIGFYGRAA